MTKERDSDGDSRGGGEAGTSADVFTTGRYDGDATEAYPESILATTFGIAGMRPDIEVQQPPDTGRGAFPGMARVVRKLEEDTEHRGIRRGEPVYGGSLPEKIAGTGQKSRRRCATLR